MPLASAAACAMFLAGCFAARVPEMSPMDAAVDATALDAGVDAAARDARVDAAARDAGVCACPCADPSRACVGRPATAVTLAVIGATTVHRARATCIELTYDPALPAPENYILAWRDWTRDCPDALCLGAITPNPELPRARCESRIHFALVGAVDEISGTCSGGEGLAGFVTDAATGEMREACVEVTPSSSYGLVLRGLGQALGIGFAPEGVASVMAVPIIDVPTELQPLDREGFCAAYGGAGYCAE